MIKFNIIIGIALLLQASNASADGLKVFGPEFCSVSPGGFCINFHHKHLKDAKTWTGQYKYPKGRMAYDECAKSSDQTDSSLAYCAMVFHREEQSLGKRSEMCHQSVRKKYWEVIEGSYAMRTYDLVWRCNRVH